jgi:hypothetical protein
MCDWFALRFRPTGPAPLVVDAGYIFTTWCELAAIMDTEVCGMMADYEYLRERGCVRSGATSRLLRLRCKTGSECQTPKLSCCNYISQKQYRSRCVCAVSHSTLPAHDWPRSSEHALESNCLAGCKLSRMRRNEATDECLRSHISRF